MKMETHREITAIVSLSKLQTPSWFLVRSDSYGDYGEEKVESDLTFLAPTGLLNYQRETRRWRTRWLTSPNPRGFDLA